MDKLIYALCASTALACAVLLLRGYFRTRFKLLLWSGLCFVGLTANNILVVLDRLVFPDINLATWRLVIAFVAIVLLVAGLILESES